MSPTRFELQRIAQLEEDLDILYEKRHHFERDVRIRESTGTQFELQQRLKREILPDLRRTEQEYATLLARVVEPDCLPELEAQTLLEDMRGALASHKDAQSGETPEEIRQLLTEIISKLDEPGKAATAKLKVVLPLIPIIASYEFELDTESFVTQVWGRVKEAFARIIPPRP